MSKSQLSTKISNHINFLFLFISIGLQMSCIKQVRKNTEIRVLDVQVKFENEILLRDFFDTAYQMKIYADSLNVLKKTDSLPSFVFNNCFDNQPIYWISLHRPISLREMVLNSTTNKSALERLCRNNKLMDVCKYENNIKIPPIEKSFSELSKERLKQL